MQMGPGTRYTLRHNATSINKDLIKFCFWTCIFILYIVLLSYFLEISVSVLAGKDLYGLPVSGLKSMHKWFEINA